MTSSSACSRAVVVLSFLGSVAGLAQVAEAQASRHDVDPGLRQSAIASYELATRTEREGFEDREHGGPGTELLRRSQQDCLIAALASYTTLPGKLAAWRVVSCAAGVEAWLLVQLAVEAFRTVEPSGIAVWTPSAGQHISPEEIARVRAAAVEVSRHVGAVRLPPGTISWPASGAPLVLTAGALPPYDIDPTRGPLTRGPVQVGDLVYLPVGAEFSAVVTASTGPQQIRATVRPLALGGPQDATVVPPPPPVVEPVVDLTPETTSAESVTEALVALQPLLDRCAQGTPITSMIAMTINSTGDVREAHAVVRSPAADCMAGVVRSQLYVPAFRQETQTLTVGVRAEPAVNTTSPTAPLADAGPTHGGGGLGLPILTMSAGVAAAVAGGVLWFMASSIRDDLDASCPSRTGCDPALRVDADRGATYTLTGNILAIGGAGVALIGALWTVVAASAGGDEPAPRSSVAPGTLSAGITPTAHGATVTLGGSF